MKIPNENIFHCMILLQCFIIFLCHALAKNELYCSLYLHMLWMFVK